jgi:regulator of protease activity HflC (stomatin/prohibitin superfamily)
MGDLMGWLGAFVTDAWDLIKPAYVVREYEGGIVLRNGNFKKDVTTGFHWKLPFFDEVILCLVATETLEVDSQSLTTKDDKNIVVKGIIKYEIRNPQKYLLKVRDVSDAISDIAQVKIKQIVMNKTWEECRGDIDKEITEAVKKEAVRWGIGVEYVGITTLAIIRTIRLIQQ